uniref:Putative cytochrome c, class I n=1 Tax=Magnetococcus massalia (strain MO-1) TaxID=451514 RepID=A0A1S7LM36_MAGMO|nr:Putative cytochrome c, class I [Candidatus Magnetococcus massalia]
MRAASVLRLLGGLLLMFGLVLYNAQRDPALADIEHLPDTIRPCMVCHDLSEEQRMSGRVGPPLWQVGDRAIGTAKDYQGYSKTLKALGQSGVIWDRATLSRYLADPRVFAPGSRMAYTGIADEEARELTVDYLFSLR